MHQSGDETFASNDLHTYHVCFPLFNLVWVSLVWSGRQTVRVCFLGLEEKKKKKACSSSLICWFRAGVCGMLQINTRTARVGGWDTQRTSHSQCHCELSTVKLRCWFSAVFFKACFGVFSPSLILHRFCRGGQIKYDNKAEGSCAVRANCHFLYVLNLNCRHSALLALQSAELTSFYQYTVFMWPHFHRGYRTNHTAAVFRCGSAGILSLWVNTEEDVLSLASNVVSTRGKSKTTQLCSQKNKVLDKHLTLSLIVFSTERAHCLLTLTGNVLFASGCRWLWCHSFGVNAIFEQSCTEITLQHNPNTSGES